MYYQPVASTQIPFPYYASPKRDPILIFLHLFITVVLGGLFLSIALILGLVGSAQGFVFLLFFGLWLVMYMAIVLSRWPRSYDVYLDRIEIRTVLFTRTLNLSQVQVSYEECVGGGFCATNYVSTLSCRPGVTIESMADCSYRVVITPEDPHAFIASVRNAQSMLHSHHYPVQTPMGYPPTPNYV